MDDEKEKIIQQLMADYKLTRDQAEEAFYLRDNPQGDVHVLPTPQAPDKPS
jgi:hypothetical protein